MSASSAELCFKTATELVDLVRQREISVLEVVTAHLEQIGRINPQVNAICTLVPDAS